MCIKVIANKSINPHYDYVFENLLILNYYSTLNQYFYGKSSEFEMLM